MADVSAGYTSFFKNFLFKRENQKQMIHRTFDLVNSLRTPSPDGWSNHVNDRNTRSSNLLFNRQIKVRSINPDVGSRAKLDSTAHHFAANF